MTIIIGTHNENFHADEVFAIACFNILMRVFSDDPSCTVIRSRKPEELAKADVLVDVGHGKFDHHMKGGAGVRDNGVPYASFGLVWREHGAEICHGSQEAADIVDVQLVQSVDAADCGYSLFDEKVPGVLPYTISQLIASMNPGWQCDDAKLYDREFERAVGVAEQVLYNEIDRAWGAIEARDFVRQAIDKVDDPRIIVLHQFAPWQEVVITEAPEALYVIYPNANTDGYKLQCVPDAVGSFGKRKALPEEWAGKKGEELQQVCGVSDAVFCHPGRFICGAESLSGAEQMAVLAVKK